MIVRYLPLILIVSAAVLALAPIEAAAQDQGIVALRIREGDRLRVTDIRFEGNANVAPGNCLGKDCRNAST